MSDSQSMENPIIVEQHQDNRKGSESIQIATQENYYGMQYHETKELCLDLINSELTIYKYEAEKIARERDENLLNNFFSRLNQEHITNQKVFEEFKNPDMQFTYIEAQKSYIKAGTKELEDTLAQLMVDRIKENNRTLLQISLGEAITIVPMLLPEQLDILALCFRLKYTKDLKINNLPTFCQYILNKLLPHLTNDISKNSLYQHLEYAKCGTISMGEISLESIFLENYTGLFLKGYPIEEVEHYISKFPNLFLRCLNNPTLYQINAMDNATLENTLKNYDIKTVDKNFITEHFTNNRMTTDEVKNFILTNAPNSLKLFDIWNTTRIKHLTLTSVGMILGANRANQLTTDKFDMNIWI